MLYLTSSEAADYLRIKERKLYELVANGGIPCSKVTGKWLFPRHELDRWVMSGLAVPPGMQPTTAAPIVGGSCDPLLEWALRESGSGLAATAEDGPTAIARMQRGELTAAALHHHASDLDDANPRVVQRIAGLHDGVLIAFARREQGLVLPAGNPKGIASLADAVTKGAKIAQRQSGTGAQALLGVLLDEMGDLRDKAKLAPPALTGPELARAVATGAADCAIATRAVAHAARLDFTPLLWDHLDLLIHAQDYFRPPLQALLRLLRDGRLRDRAADLQGYDVTHAGDIRYAP